LKLVLDTNIYCDYAEGLVDAVDAIATYGQGIFIPSIVLGELFFGFMKGSRQQFNEKKLRQVVNRLKIEIIDVNTDVARKYALIYLTLQKKGIKIPINDVWIAACCMEIGGTLLTRDKHFELVDQIEAIVLKKGPRNQYP
jgi:predicted nucleic acid-binding protein